MPGNSVTDNEDVVDWDKISARVAFRKEWQRKALNDDVGEDDGEEVIRSNKVRRVRRKR